MLVNNERWYYSMSGFGMRWPSHICVVLVSVRGLALVLCAPVSWASSLIIAFHLWCEFRLERQEFFIACFLTYFDQDFLMRIALTMVYGFGKPLAAGAKRFRSHKWSFRMAGLGLFFGWAPSVILSILYYLAGTGNIRTLISGVLWPIRIFSVIYLSCGFQHVLGVKQNLMVGGISFLR